MKGDTTIGELVGLMVIIALSVFNGFMILYLDNVSSTFGFKQTYALTVTSMYKPLSSETELLAFLELNTTTGKQVKELLPILLEQGQVDIKMPDGSDFNFGSFANNIFNSWSGKNPYILVLSSEDGTIDIAENGYFNKEESYQVACVNVTSISGNGKLTLYIGYR